jgi:hypothetical protein
MWRSGLHYRNLITIAILIIGINISQSQQFTIDSRIVNFSPSGPKAAAMGRAQTAIANDSYSLGWNPAGLASMKKPRATFSGMLDFGDMRLEPPNELSSFHTYAVNQRGNGSLNYLGFVLPFKFKQKDVVTAIVFRNQSNLHNNLSYNITDNVNENSQLYDIFSDGGVYMFSGGISTNVLADLSFGLGLNLMTGTSKRKINDQFLTVADTVSAWEKWQNKYSGMSIDFGFQWSPVNIISFGGKISFPSTINITNLEYSNSNGKAIKYDFDGYIKQNTQIVYGFGFHLSRNFVIAIDYNIRPFSKANVYLGDENLVDYFQDDQSLNIGAEYVVRTDGAKFPLRFGYFKKAQQINNFSENEQSENPVYANYITSGFGARFQNISFAISFEYKMIDYNTDFLGTNQGFKVNQSKVQVIGGMEIAL